MVTVKRVVGCWILALVFSQAFDPVFTPAWALTCDEVLANHRKAISEKLSELPGLRDMILQMIGDPLIPSNLKRILRVALIDENTEIRQLTEQVRRVLNLPQTLTAAHTSWKLSFRKVVSNNSKNVSANKAASNNLNKARITSKHTIFVPDRPLSKETNDFITLVHELAHVRFDAFLERHLPSLLRKVPTDLIRMAEDGVIEIEWEFHDYLSERYAFQTEFELLLATVVRYYPDRYSRYGFDVTRKNYRWSISEAILENYKVTDPRVVGLKEFSIAQILLGVPF